MIAVPPWLGDIMPVVAGDAGAPAAGPLRWRGSGSSV